MIRDSSKSEAIAFEEKPDKRKNKHDAERADHLCPSCVAKDELSPVLVFSIHLNQLPMLH